MITWVRDWWAFRQRHKAIRQFWASQIGRDR